MSYFYAFNIVIYVILSIILSTVILLQESKSLGLGGGLGSESGNSLLGTSAAEIVKKITAWAIAIFIIMGLLISFYTNLTSDKSIYQDRLKEFKEQFMRYDDSGVK